jgi:hypothetical protein
MSPYDRSGMASRPCRKTTDKQKKAKTISNERSNVHFIFPLDNERRLSASHNPGALGIDSQRRGAWQFFSF